MAVLTEDGWVVDEIRPHMLRGTYTYATLPAASSVQAGTQAYTTDYGPVYSDGTDWIYQRNFVLASSGVAIPLTGSTSATVLAVIPIPAGVMGPNGSLRVTHLWRYTNSANNKTPSLFFGNASATGSSGTDYVTLYNAVVTTTLTSHFQHTLTNRGSQASQVGNGSGTATIYGSTSVDTVTSTVDTSVAQNVVFKGQLANSGETLSLERYVIEVLRP